MGKKFEKHVKRRVREIRQREQKFRKLTFNGSCKVNHNKHSN